MINYYYYFIYNILKIPLPIKLFKNTKQFKNHLILNYAAIIIIPNIIIKIGLKIKKTFPESNFGRIEMIPITPKTISANLI